MESPEILMSKRVRLVQPFITLLFLVAGCQAPVARDSAPVMARDTIPVFSPSPAQHIESSQITRENPPVEKRDFRQPDLVELIKVDATLKLDIRYATSNNFVGKPVYTEARAFLQRPAAEALKRASARLQKEGYGLLIFDGYRPWAITKLFWDITSGDQRNYVADPAKGSKHNRGCAIDLSLYDLKTGKEVEMPGAYDEMTERSWPAYTGGSAESRRLRDLLREAMEAEHFQVNQYEWWHFDYQDWQKYPILNISFQQIGKL